MKIRAFIQRGRQLYAQCHGPHPGDPVRGEGIAFPRRVALRCRVRSTVARAGMLELDRLERPTNVGAGCADVM